MSVYGWADVDPSRDVVAGSTGSWKITFTAGDYGIDDGGSILLVNKYVSDWEEPQFTSPESSGYVTASTTGDAELQLSYSRLSFCRPWFNSLKVDILDGSLKEGDKVEIILGDRSQGGPGIRAQTFQEQDYLFKVFVDPFRAKVYYEVPSPKVSIVGGLASTLCALVPSTVRVNEPFSMLVKALDSWGNISATYTGTIEFSSTREVDGLPSFYTFREEDKGTTRLSDVKITREGVYRFKIEDKNGLTGLSNPVSCREEEPALRLYWGDLHGQTHGRSRKMPSDTVGTGTPREYFRFARDVGGLDFCSWQGNDFQVSEDLWRDVCNETERFNTPGRFVTFLGYEWSGNTPTGGDHNLYYLEDHQPIYRSSHALVENKSELEKEKSSISQLWKTFRGRRDIMAVPHVGGRYANFDYYDPELIRLIEVYSFHGAFEWFADEALSREFKVGFIAGSDDHTCRPGIQFSMARKDKTKGGLAGVHARSLTRKEVWDALWQRHCYGTTGARIILNIDIDRHPMGDEIVLTKPPRIRVRVHGTERILEVLIKRGREIIYRHPSHIPSSDAGRILLMWSGARSKSRNKVTNWDGRISVDRGQILSFKPFAFQKSGLLESLTRISDQVISWRSFTIGDYKGVFLELEAEDNTTLTFRSIQKSFTFKLKDVTAVPFAVEAGQIDQKVTVRKVPKDIGSMDLEIEHLDDEVKKGWNPYWVRVQQSDGEMAWSSPIYACYK